MLVSIKQAFEQPLNSIYDNQGTDVMPISINDLKQYYAFYTKKKFIIDDNNQEAIKKILNAFSNPLQKGVLLSGNIGTGKSEIFRMLSLITYAFKSQNAFYTAKVMELTDNYSAYGEKWLSEYNGQICDKDLYIDDLGLEEPIQLIYGNKVDLIGKMLLKRYELFQTRGLITHASTNLTTDQLKNRYGARLYDRFKEMFEIILLTGESRRK